MSSIASTGASSYPLDEVRLLAPVRPRKFLAIGLNYADHIAESGMEAPQFPVFFNKQVTCVVGPDDDVHMPRVSSLLDYEGELAIVIGTRCRHVPVERAHEVIAGYTIANDVSVRDWQVRTPTMTMGKSFDTHGPLGPWLVTPDELGDPHDLAIRTYVNDELRQDGNTREMIYNCFQQIAHLSEAFTLEPGDVIATGTPGRDRRRTPAVPGRPAQGRRRRPRSDRRDRRAVQHRGRGARGLPRPRDGGRGGMGALTTENELLWPSFHGPDDLAAVERVPLSERGLPASTYELVRRAAELWPARPAVSVMPDAESFHTPLVRTFAELAGDVHRAAAVLAELGVRRGEAVAVVSVNCAEMLPLLLAAEAVGIYTPINPGLTAEHATELVRRSGAGVIVASGPELDPHVWAHAREIATNTGARALLAFRPTAASENRPRSSRSTASRSPTSKPGWPRPATAGCHPRRLGRATSPATCIPAARLALRSSPRARTRTRSPTHG